MEREGLTTRNSLEIAALGVLVSAIVSLGVIFTIRLLTGGRRRSPAPDQWNSSSTQDAPPPIQPAVDIEMPAHVPHHFTEDVIIPGFTETGQDIERQDVTDGRSPEGV